MSDGSGMLRGERSLANLELFNAHVIEFTERFCSWAAHDYYLSTWVARPSIPGVSYPWEMYYETVMKVSKSHTYILVTLIIILSMQNISNIIKVWNTLISYISDEVANIANKL